MFSITITDKNGAQRQLDFDVSELTIGRVDDNQLVLPKNNVSKQHARLVRKDGRYVLSDLKSTNGTYVNGRRIASPVVVREGDKIYIGDFILGLGAPSGAPGMSPVFSTPPRMGGSDGRPGVTSRTAVDEPGAADGDRVAATVAPPVTISSGRKFPPPGPPDSLDAEEPTTQMSSGRPSAPPPPPSPPPSSPRVSQRPPRVEDPESTAGALTSPAVLTPSVRLQGALATLMERLAERMDITRPGESAFPSQDASVLEQLLEQLDSEGVLGADVDRRFLREAAISEAVGLGPLDRLLRNHAVRELVVDGPSRILADLGGGLSPVSSFFSSSPAVLTVARRLLSRAGAELDEAPSQKAVLNDGTQILVLMPPLSTQGPLISVRRPLSSPVSPEGLVTEGLFSSDMLELLRAAVRARLNVLVTGPSGSGVSMLCGALGGLVHDHERIVSLHSGPGVTIAHPQVLSLSRSGAPNEPLSQLLEYAAQLRYDRLLIDDVRPQDALCMLTTASGCRGLIMGMHAPTATIALEQLELFAQLNLPGSPSSMAALLAHAVQLVVHLRVEGDGVRRVEAIAEVRAVGGERLELRPLFVFDGAFRASEHRPSF